ncbi:hypothetical protein PHISCL_09712 [Aspergillus sclerotialis]|uniref:Altered inheritance of mitochondria protein 13, mitochondrial n=1 Tax=Aspergillus sclerotialis TaxID=2070753 RepID=A0A3A2Z5I9_9EURO|nr:hypothetical protein PHISCL_09712 [Aspergillus sclerotialis]
MGSGSSKPEASAGSKHVFSSESPVQFSSNLVDVLQTSSETDSSRAKTLELQIQARVAEELDRLRKREQQTLAEIESRLAELKDDSIPPPASTTPTTSSAATNISHTPGSLNLDAPRIPFAGRDHTPVAAPQDNPINRSISRESVNQEIEALRTKLEGRTQLVKLDEGVEKARKDVVSCLRLNDRRPLDCWKEVEEFKGQVARMEEAFVDRIVG